MKRLLYEPVILGSALKAVLAVGTVLGLSLTNVQSEAIVAAVLANLAAFGAITAKTRAVVTPLAKVEDLGRTLGGNATKLVDHITGQFHL